MANKYQSVFFDLDHTLWDYDKNAEDTLVALYDKHDLSQLGARSAGDFVTHFLAVNDELWSQFNVGKISKSFLRNERFTQVFERSGIELNGLAPGFSQVFSREFLVECPLRSAVIEGTVEILEYLKNNYHLHIITNGFEETQTVKMKSAGILEYFDKVITSEKAGFKKPAAGIFYYALKHSRAELNTSIFIGDNLQTDIKGARDYGMDHVFFNPREVRPDVSPTYEITRLDQLKDIL